MKFCELKEGDKLLFKQDLQKSDYVEDLQEQINNIITFKCKGDIFANNHFKCYENRYEMWYWLFAKVIRNGNVYDVKA